MNKIMPGLYRHYKGGDYFVIGVARHHETLDLLVVYRGVTMGGIWVRELASFTQTVDGVPRFKRIEWTARDDLVDVTKLSESEPRHIEGIPPHEL